MYDDLLAPYDPPEVAHFRARLDRAREHFSEFGRIWAGYLEQRPHRLLVEIDYEDTGAGVLRVQREIPIPIALRISLGVLVSQLRPALDNCLYAVAVIDSGASPPPGASSLEWPICIDQGAWKRNKSRYRYLSPQLQENLHAIQPFQAQFPGWNALRILHDLARTDRHRRLHDLELHAEYGRIGYDTNVIADLDVRRGVLDESGIVATFKYSGTGRIAQRQLPVDLRWDPEVRDVEFAVGPTTSGEPARPYGPLDKRLRFIYDMVNRYTAELIAVAHDLRGNLPEV